MMLKNKWVKFSLVLFLLPLVCILVTYNKLPAQVATHFDIHGAPDGYMDKFLGLYGLWGFMLVLHIFCAFMTFKDPKKSNILIIRKEQHHQSHKVHHLYHQLHH